jgi:hypothetical protein
MVINGQTADFDDLEEMLTAIDAMTGAINDEFDRLSASSMNYSSTTGLSISYYAFTDAAGKSQRSLSVTFKETHFGQGPSLDRLTRLRTLILQAREKLISVGASKAGQPSR